MLRKQSGTAYLVWRLKLMHKEEVIEQGERALNEMIHAREAYCKSKRASFTSRAFDDTLYLADDEIDGCCLSMVFILLLAVPFFIMGMVEKDILNKKAQPIMKQARVECDLYIKKMVQYLPDHPDNRIFLQACSAFVQNSYIGPLRKRKVFFGLLKKDEDWRMRSIDMAIQDIKYHLNIMRLK